MTLRPHRGRCAHCGHDHDAARKMAEYRAAATPPPSVEPQQGAEAERARFEAKFPMPAGVQWDGGNYEVKDDYINSYACDRFVAQWVAWLTAQAPRPLAAVAEPIAAVREGKLTWHIPKADSSVPVDLLHGTHWLYLAPLPQSAAVPLTCEWSQDGNEDGSWFSACGGDPWSFEAEDPTKNGMRFCIHCGKRMVQHGIGPVTQEVKS